VVTGEVRDYDPRKGWGFAVADSGGPDIFFHVKDLVPGQDPTRLRPGASVSFTVTEQAKGLKAHEVRIISRARRQPAFSPRAEDGETDVLTADQFDRELRTLLLDSTAGLREALTALARNHGWVRS
jgi:cold shock CspA family protein